VPVISAIIRRDNEYPDVIQTDFWVYAAYEKPALGLTILREQILGEERFDFAFKTYIKRWAFKHPTPWDFFHSMDNAAGEDLSWFWNEWFLQTWKLDQGVKAINYTDNDAKGALNYHRKPGRNGPACNRLCNGGERQKQNH
jgi:hypothetical protein